MKESFNNVVIYNGYPLSLVVAVTFHSLILALLMYFQSSKGPEALELVQPTVVKALLVQENPQVANERKRLERQQQQQQQRVRDQEAAQRAAEAERQRQEQQQAEARAEEQRQARELASLRQRQEQERKNAEQLAREQAQREQNEREAEQRRQRELAEAQRQQESRERDRQRQQEAAEAAAAELASSEFEMVQSGTALIQQLVQEQWSRPPSARNGMRAVLQIRMQPTGDLVDAVITESSGDPAFDRSAENAVYRAAPFIELQALPINVFNANFRVLSLIFQPEDLLN